MNAEIWTIIAVGMALTGLQWRMHVSLSAGLNGRMDRIEARIESRFASFDTRLAGFETRLDSVNARLDALKDDVGGMKERLSRIEGWIAGRFREENIPAG